MNGESPGVENNVPRGGRLPGRTQGIAVDWRRYPTWPRSRTARRGWDMNGESLDVKDDVPRGGPWTGRARGVDAVKRRNNK